MNRATGYRKDREDHGLPLWHHSRRMQGAMMSPVPKSASVADWCPPILDQGATGSCIGHGTSSALAAACALNGTPLGFIPSPRGIYAAAREIERARITPVKRALPELTDSGAMPADALEGIREIGIAPMGPLVDGRRSDCDESNVLLDSSLLDLTTSAGHLIVGPYRLLYSGVTLLNAILASLASHAPVGIGIFVDGRFQDWTPSGGPLGGTPDFADPNGGGHWVMIQTVETLSTGQRIATIRNSWGESWGDNGCIEVTEEWLVASASDPTAFVVEAAA